MPELSELRHFPQLVSLAMLDAALHNTTQALLASYPDLITLAWNPNADPLLRLAAAIQTSASSLRTLLDHYQAEAIRAAINDIPW